MKLIGLTGLPRTGKDTIASILCARYGYVRRAFAAPLKEAAAVLLGRELWEMEGAQGFDREAVLPEWGFSTRWFLQVLGTECLRQQVRSDFWATHMRNRLAGCTRAVITDVRFPNEVELVHSLGGVVVEITRPGAVASTHASDRGVASDVTISNHGNMVDLNGTIDRWVQSNGLA